MFTGIVEEVGRIVSVESRGDVVAVQIEAERVLSDLPIGGSIAVSGCCLTAIAVGPRRFECELTPETLARTRFGESLVIGGAVNLERPLRADGRFDGHIVQGHVDAVGRVVEARRLGASAELDVALPSGTERYVVEKGSLAIEGVSLTVARLAGGTVTIALIPFTLTHTNLQALTAGAPINLELDVVAKYVERLLSYRSPL
jgi:riboflavin synthase